MNADPNRVAKLFKMFLSIVAVIYVGNTAYKIYVAMKEGQDSIIESSVYAADLLVISSAIIITSIFYTVRWFKGKEERDFVKKYKSQKK